MKFEIHLTISQPDSIERFITVCKLTGVKPLVIATGGYDQVMTSSMWTGEDFKMQVNRIRLKLENENFNVVREKVEIMPQITPHPTHKYYESHIRVKIPLHKTEDWGKIDLLCSHKRLHKSRNLFKVDEMYKYQMLTYRTYTDTIWQFGTHIEDVKDYMGHCGLWFDKVELEECIYDTNLDIDSKWLNIKS